MKLKEDFSIRKIGDEYMMVTKTGSGLDYTRVVTLNHTAVYLIEAVQGKEFTVEDWVDLLVEKYGIERPAARKDVQALTDKLIKENIVEN